MPHKPWTELRDEWWKQLSWQQKVKYKLLIKPWVRFRTRLGR